MSHNDCITNLLNLKEQHLNFAINFCQNLLIKGIICKVFFATLSYKPDACYHCGCSFDDKIIKWGFKSVTITLPKVSGFKTLLKLKKQRFYCKHCDSTFTLNTTIIEKHCSISNNTKHSIALDSKNKTSEKDIASRHNVSHSTVNRVINSFYEHHKLNYNYLPKHLCFDEFKSVKAASGKMSFIFCNSESKEIIDIVEDRKLYSLTKYFHRFSKEARESVETIVIDMYSPYMTLIKDVFPNAKIIIDKFHIVQLLTRSLNKTRIRVMNNNKQEYYKLKKYWKLLLKDIDNVDTTYYHYNRSFKDRMREIDIINYLLDIDPELKATYHMYQDLKHCINTKNFELLKYTLANNNYLVSTYMITSIKTLKKFLPHIENTFKYNYTNGLIEGINNKIKVIKRIAFGYRSFQHFKTRILITQNLIKLKSA